MNHEENLVYDWLNNFRQLNEEETPSVAFEPAKIIVGRAFAAYQAGNWNYQLGGKPDYKSILPGMPASCDCTGFIIWCWGAEPNKRMSDVGSRVSGPEVGSAFWWDAQPGHTYGHGGIIVAVHGNGDFDTIDCGLSAGGLRYKQNVKGFWSGPGSAGGYQNLEFWRANSVPANLANPEFAGTMGGSAEDSFSGGDYSGDWKTSFIKSLELLGLKENNNNFSSSKWKEYKQIIKENTSNCLSDDQIAKLLFDVGFRDEDLVTAVRIVIGESGGCPQATNINRGSSGKYRNSVDRGIFQFNNVAFPNLSDEDAFDPIKSAQYAFRVYKKVGFKPWSGKTQFHTLKHKDLTPDTNKIERAKNAVAKLTGYISTGNFEYLPQGQTTDSSSIQQGETDWKSGFVGALQNLGLKESKVRIGKKFIVVNKSKNKDIEDNKKILFSMLKYYDDKLQFDLPVKIIFKDDRDNSQKPLGKTGYYHPEETSITIFTTNRLLKDILRSLGHELIHHKQHCMHPFEHENTPEGYAQSDKRLRRKEKEAYLFGNMLFRDFEDNYKTKHKGVF